MKTLAPPDLSVAADGLFARIQLACPDCRSILITAPRSADDTQAVAAALAAAVERAGLSARLISFDGSSPEEFSTRHQARITMASSEGYTVVAASGILDRPRVLIAAAAADAVVITAREGKTLRSHLQDVRDEIEAAAGNIIAGFLLR